MEGEPARAQAGEREEGRIKGGRKTAEESKEREGDLEIEYEKVICLFVSHVAIMRDILCSACAMIMIQQMRYVQSKQGIGHPTRTAV